MNSSLANCIEFEGTHLLTAEIESVWCELNNPSALIYCIRQCESLDRVSDTNYRANFRVGVGPLKVPVGADLEVIPLEPPRRYQLSSNIALRFLGDASGKADVHLKTEGAFVEVEYMASVSLDGRIADFAQDLIRGAARRNLERFFERFQYWTDRNGRA